MRPLPLAAAGLVGALVLLTAGPALAAPTCVDPLTRPACGGRVVPEAALSVSQHQFDGAADNLADTLAALADVAPDGFFTPTSIGKSAGGRELWVVKITDPTVPSTGKVQSAISLSVHGLEPAGREGGLRYLEDLATWLATDPGHLLYAGETSMSVSALFKQVEYYVAFTNPDGWAAQDLDADNQSSGGTTPRYNAAGADLNRDFPTLGWVDRSSSGGSGSKRGPMSDQPESRLWYGLLASLPDLRSAGDIHGELTSVNDAFSDIMWPAGQWSPDHQAKELQLAEDMIATVERKFDDDGVVLGALFGPTIGQRPANVATGYDVVGYDDSGFMGDAMQRLNNGRVVEIDVENFLSHLAPNVLWASPVEQAHIAAVRGNMEALLVTALKERDVTASLDLGRVGFVDDPARVTSADGTGFDLVAGERQVPYDVSRLTYFQDLATDAGTTIPGLAAADVGSADLGGFDSLVLSDVEVPKDTRGRPVDRAAYVRALRAFVDGGGQLVLTDSAVTLLDDLGVLDASAQTVQRTNAGHVDFITGEHPFKAGLFGVPSQTYYEVALGFPAKGQSPHHGITTAAWTEAGGTTVGTVGTSTVLGELPQGRGKITIFGAILPQPIESLASTETPHPEGLADYAVTIAGGQVLHNVLAYRAAGRTAATPAAPAGKPATGGPKGLAATGLSTLPGLLGLVLLLGAVARRRATPRPAEGPRP